MQKQRRDGPLKFALGFHWEEGGENGVGMGKKKYVLLSSLIPWVIWAEFWIKAQLMELESAFDLNIPL